MQEPLLKTVLTDTKSRISFRAVFERYRKGDIFLIVFHFCSSAWKLIFFFKVISVWNLLPLPVYTATYQFQPIIRITLWMLGIEVPILSAEWMSWTQAQCELLVQLGKLVSINRIKWVGRRSHSQFVLSHVPSS